MKLTLLMIVTSCLLTLAPAVSAQESAPPAGKPEPGRQKIAVISVGEVFKNHFRFKAMLADMKGDVARAGERIKAEQEEIKKMAKDLKDMLAGTRDYLDLHEEINQRGKELQTRVQLEKAEFVQREAKAYHAIYKEIVEEVARYGEQNGIEVVLRVNTTVEEPKTPQQVIQSINNQVVWFADSRNITQAILERLNSKGGKPKPKKP